MADGGRLPVAALGLAIAAGVSSWNPLAAPFAIVAAVGATVLAVRALRAGANRQAALSALGVAVAAGLVSLVVLALTAGLGRELGGTPVVAAPARSDVEAELDAAAERTRAARDRARSELERLGGGGQQPGRPAEAGPPPAPRR